MMTWMTSPSAFSTVYMYEVSDQEWWVLIKVWDLWLCMSLRGNVCYRCPATSCLEIPVWMTVPGSRLLKSLMSSWCSWPSVKSALGSGHADERERTELESIKSFFSPHVQTTWFDFKYVIWSLGLRAQGAQKLYKCVKFSLWKWFDWRAGAH